MCLYLVDYFNSKPFFPVRENFKVTITRHLKVLKKCSSEEDVPPAQGIWKGFGLIDIISDWYPGSIRMYACTIPSLSTSRTQASLRVGTQLSIGLCFQSLVHSTYLNIE